MAGIAALAGAGASIYGALSSKDTASNVQLPPQFQMPNMGGAASNAFNAIGNLPGTNIGATTVPWAQQTATNLYNNPGAAGLLQGAYGSQALGQGAALGQYGLGGAEAGYGGGMLPYGQALAQMGFDPQTALYNRTLGQVEQQTGNQLANTGVGNTPYGAGVMGNTLSNFNIDWQNNALQRALAGAQGAGQVGRDAGGAIQAGTGLQSGAATGYGSFGAAPYLGNQAIGQGQFGALNSFQGIGQGAQGLAQTPIQDYLSYLGQGTQQQNANTAVARTGLDQANMAFNQNQVLGQNLGAGLYGAGRGIQQGFPGAQSLWGGMGSNMMAGTPWGQ